MLQLLDKFLNWCGLVRRSRHDQVLYRTRLSAFDAGLRGGRESCAAEVADAHRRLAVMRLVTSTATRQRDALQEALDRANRRLEHEGLMPVVTFI